MTSLRLIAGLFSASAAYKVESSMEVVPTDFPVREAS